MQTQVCEIHALKMQIDARTKDAVHTCIKCGHVETHSLHSFPEIKDTTNVVD